MKFEHCKDCRWKVNKRFCKKCTSKIIGSKKSYYSHKDWDYQGWYKGSYEEAADKSRARNKVQNESE